MKKNICTIVMSIILCAQMFATVYYVAPAAGGGSDGNDGSSAHPWLTIQKACNTLTPGDTVMIKAGTYAEKIIMNVQGSVGGGFVTIMNYGSDHVIVDGTGKSAEANIYINNKSYIRIIGFDIANNTAAGVPIGINIEGKGSNVIIKNCKVHNIVTQDTDAHGIAVYATDGTTPYSNIILDGNEVFNCTLGTSESVVLNGNVTNFQVINNIVHDNDNIGIDFIGFEGTASTNDQARDGICANNTVYNISSDGNPGYGAGELSADGIYVDGGRRIIIEKNIVHNCNIGIEVASEHLNKLTDSVIVRDNFISNCDVTGIAFGGYDTDRGWAAYCTFLNNTLYNNATDPTLGDGQIMMQKSHDNIIRNNIIHLGSQTGDAVTNWFDAAYTYNNVFDYNMFYSTAGAANTGFVWQNTWYESFAEWKTATGYDAHSVFADPKLVSTSDFHLQSTSPAINVGDPAFVTAAGETDIDGEVRVNDSHVDIGADEYHLPSGVIAATTSNIYAIFPNPNNGKFNIAFNDVVKEECAISITAITGQEVYKEQFNSGTVHANIDLSNQSAGMYLIMIKYGQEKYFDKVVIR